MQMPGITLLRGEASFEDAHSIRVGNDVYTAQHIIIATGSRAKLPPIKGIAGNSKVVTSTELLNITEIPQRLAIIGAGVIGMEFASVFQQFGSEVTVTEFLKECLPTMDKDIAKRLRKSLEKQGVTFRMNTAVQHIDELDADLILIATGRSANTEGLHLENADITCGPKGISVNPETFQVNGKEHIYAIGDVNGQALLAHAATMQGIRAVNHILGKEDHIRFDIMPAAVFTTPEAAGVGITEEQAKEFGINYTCKKGFYRANGKALAIGEPEGIVKILADSQDRLIGCHILGAHAADMVQEIAALMNMGTTISQLRDIIHIHPTLSEILQSAAEG